MRTKYRTLLEFMKGQHVSQAELARKVGVTQSYMSRIAHGQDTPLLALAVKIHKATGVPYESMLKKEGATK